MKKTDNIGEYMGIFSMAQKKGRFSELYVRGSKTIIVDGCGIIQFSGSVSEFDKDMRKWFFSITGQAKKHVNKYIHEHNYCVQPIPKKDSRARIKDDAIWNDIPVGGEFWCIDINSCYWQMAYKLGYISEKLYNTYVDLADFKLIKQLSLSFLPKRSHKDYYKNGEKIWSINCENEQWDIIYKNITSKSFNLIHELELIVRKQNVLMRLSDAIYVKYSHVAAIEDYLNDANVKYKTLQCVKLSPSTYNMDDELKNFFSGEIIRKATAVST